MGTTDFAAALDEVLASAAERRTAVMCTESLWWRCHRRLLADAVVLTRAPGFGICSTTAAARRT